MYLLVALSYFHLALLLYSKMHLFRIRYGRLVGSDCWGRKEACFNTVICNLPMVRVRNYSEGKRLCLLLEVHGRRERT